MGVVYRAHDPQLDRFVAVKVISERFAADPGWRGMFLRESRLAASIEHPNVVPVYSAGNDGGRVFIAMRFIEGRSLQRTVAVEGPLAPPHAVRLIAQIADALETAHRRGLLHRDVSPGNILISQVADGEARALLTDFGIAVRVGEVARGRWAGTPSYRAPEAIRDGTLDGRTDIYSLGCVLYLALTGVAPFDAHDKRQILVGHLVDPPPVPSQITEGIPVGLDAVVRRAMAKRPEERFHSAAEFREALREVASRDLSDPVERSRQRLEDAAQAWVAADRGEGLLVTGTALGLWLTERHDPDSDQVSEFLRACTEARESRQRRRRRRTGAGVVAALVTVALLAGLGWFAASQRGSASDARAVARSARLTAASLSQRSLDPELSVLLALRAVDESPGADAQSALRMAVRTATLATLLPAAPGEDSRLAQGGWLVRYRPKEVRVTDPSTRSTRSVPAALGAPFVLSLDSQGRRAAIWERGRTGAIQIADIREGRVVASIPGVRGMTSLALSPDGELVAAVTKPGVLTTWEAAGGREVLRTRCGCSGVAFGADSRRLLSFGPEIAGAEWRDARTGRPRGRLAFPDRVQQIVVASRSGVARATGAVVVFDTHDPTDWRRIRTPSAPRSIDITRDGEWVAILGQDGAARVFAANRARTDFLAMPSVAAPESIAFSRASDALLATDQEGRVRTWNWRSAAADEASTGRRASQVSLLIRVPLMVITNSGTVHASLDNGPVHWPVGARSVLPLASDPSQPTFSTTVLRPDGRPVADVQVLMSAHPSVAVRLLNAAPGRDAVPSGRWSTMALSGDGGTVVLGAPGKVALFEAAGSAVNVRDVAEIVTTVAADEHADTVMAGGDQTALVWDRGGHLLSTIPAGDHSKVALSRDGRVAATFGAGGRITIWDVNRAIPLRRLQARPPAAVAQGLAFTADGSALLAVSGSSVVVWDWRSGAESFRARPVGTLITAAISPDSRWVASLSQVPGGATLTRWRCEVCGGLAEVVALATARAPRELTDQELRRFAGG